MAQAHGLTVEGGALSDIDLRHGFDINFRVGIPLPDGAIYSPDKALFEVLALHFGLAPTDYGRTEVVPENQTRFFSSFFPAITNLKMSDRCAQLAAHKNSSASLFSDGVRAR